jgi:hypothetical protein
VTETFQYIVALREADQIVDSGSTVAGECFRCHQTVVLHPSGHRMLRAHPEPKPRLVCSVCVPTVAEENREDWDGEDIVLTDEQYEEICRYLRGRGQIPPSREYLVAMARRHVGLKPVES